MRLVIPHSHYCQECSKECRVGCTCFTPLTECCCNACAQFRMAEDEHNTNALYAHDD